MLQIRPPGPDADKWPGDWLRLTEAFFPSLRQAVASRALDSGAIQRALDAWQWSAVSVAEERLSFPEAMCRMRIMLWCADHLQRSASLRDQAQPAVLTQLPPNAPAEVRERADWSLACARILQGEASRKRIAVPIALADEMIQLKGGIATLVFEVYSPGNGRLALNPEETFRILPDEDFTESLSRAWRIALEVAKDEDGRSEFPDVVWRVIRESPSMSGLEEQAFFESAGLRLKGRITGRSASGAALRGFRHLLRGTDPKPDVFVLAQVQRDSTAASRLGSVGGISAKAEAIANAGRCATVIVTEKDKAEAALAISRKNAGTRVEIEVDIPPSIQKLLDDAKKLFDEDRFADGIPVLEKALIVASATKARIAEAKIHLRLGHAFFEGREDGAVAEQHFRKALELVGESPSIARHSALHGLGDMLLWAGRLDEAGAVIQSGLAVAQAQADQDSIARSLISLGLLERALGKAPEAAARFDGAIEILHQLSLVLKGEKRLENAHVLAVCYANKAHLARAEGHREEALALYAKVQEQHAISEDKLNSGKAHLEVGKMHCANADAEAGFQSFKRALEIFLELKNPLWMARTASAFARLHAQHERWEDAAQAALAAQDGFKEANVKAERVESLLFTAEMFAHLVRWGLHENVRKQIHDICKTVPEELQPQAAAEFSVQMERVHAEIDEKVRTDEAIGRSISEAHALAEKEQLHEERAECYLAELRLRTAKDDTDGRKRLREHALECFEKALAATNIPKRRARLMAGIGAQCRELGRKTEWANWVKRVGEVCKKAGDVYGLATYYSEMGGVYCNLGRLEDEIASGRKMLELIEGRSFYDLAAAGRINLAHSLRLRREFEESLRLLTEAEAICDTHRLQGMVGKIARIRSEIEEEVEASQAAQLSLPQLLSSLHQLVRFKPQDAAGYLAFWYYAWKTQLMSVLRSGPGVSLMVVTDNAERFMSFAARFANLADHFAMATTTEPTAVAASRTLHIPPRWRYPVTYRFVAQIKPASDGNALSPASESDVPPNVRVVGPARRLPPYTHVSIGNGGSRISVVDTPHLPPEALQLMLQRPIRDLIQRRAVWFPSPRHESDDPFLTDLRVGHEHRLFPVYFDRLPTSDAAIAIGGVEVPVQASILAPGAQRLADKWKRALLKITRLQRDEAQTVLLELPDAFTIGDDNQVCARIEVHLFEFTEISRKVIHPVLLIR